MKRNHILRTALATIVLSTVLLALPALAQTTTVNVSYSWTAPTTGSPVVNYVVEQKIGTGSWTQVGTSSTTSYTLAATVGVAHQIRVAGVDAQARQGIFSVASDAYTPDAGAPGQPGKPIRF